MSLLNSPDPAVRAAVVQQDLGNVLHPIVQSISENDHDHENPNFCWQRSLDGGIHLDCSASRFGGPLGVKGGGRAVR